MNGEDGVCMLPDFVVCFSGTASFSLQNPQKGFPAWLSHPSPQEQPTSLHDVSIITEMFLSKDI